MAIVRVQLARGLASPPVIGKWNVYSGAWFSTPTTTPTSTVIQYLRRLFLGMDATNSSGSKWTDTRMFNTGTGNATMTVWERVAGLNVKVGDFATTIEASFPAVATQYLPSQCQIAVGYRTTMAGGNQQAGRSRFFLGPLLPVASFVAGNLGRDAYLTTGAVDRVVTNALSCITALEAAGWQLMVKSTVSGVTTFWDAEEIYVDDVFDIQRSRRAWSTYQNRVSF